jgi:hypothetical protein
MIGFASLWILTLTACNQDEERVRQAMATMSSASLTDEQAMEVTYGEARSQALLIDSEELRDEVLGELADLHQQRRRPFEEARQRAEEARRQAEAEAHARRMAEIAAEERRAREEASQDRVREGIEGLRWSTRISLLDDTLVLRLSNPGSHSVDFHLRCYTRNRSFNKTIFVSVPAHGVKEIGFLEGWPNNFVRGETCQALHDGEQVWWLEIS